MAGAIVVDPRELKDAADAVADRVELCNRAGRALAGVDLGCEMPAGVAGKVRALVDGARADLIASTARIGPLTADLLSRVDQAKRADQIGKAFGGLLNAAGITADQFKLGGARIPLSPEELARGVDPNSKPLIFGKSAPPAAALKWASRMGKGLKYLGDAVNVINVAKNAMANPYLTDEQKKIKIAAEGGSSILKTAMAAAAGGAVAGSIVPGPGTAAGAAGAFVVGLGVGIGASIGLDKADKKWGGTKAIERDLTKIAADVRQGADKVASGVSGAAKDVGRGADKLGAAVKDVGRGAETVVAGAEKTVKNAAADVQEGAKKVVAGADEAAGKAAGKAKDAVDGALDKVGL